jgi:hypothetical protein
MSTWEDELREYFPGYLLPSSALETLSREAAQQFLAQLGGGADALTLLLAASALSPVSDAVRAFAKELPLVARVLPSRTEVARVESEGFVRGRLDVAGTLRSRPRNPSQVVSRVRNPHFDLPENVLLVVTAERLMGLLAKLEESGATSKDTKSGWAAGFRACADKIRHTLHATVLRDVPRSPLAAFHEQAARAAHHPAYGLALRLYEAMKDMDRTDAATLARLVAEGALAPLEAATRFEIAVLIRLGRSIERVLTSRGHAPARRGLIEQDRGYVFEFHAGDRRLRIHYNKLCFQKFGLYDRGIQHYFGEPGRFRQDITVELLENDKRIRAAIVEVKLSDDNSYLRDGYQQALIYRAEYSDDLTGWPKVILVVSKEGAIRAAPRREDDVVAVGWKNWVPDSVLDGLLEGFGA